MIDKTITPEHVVFVAYVGKYPNLCSGTLTLEIDGKTVVFGDNKQADHPRFWICSEGGYPNYKNTCEWLIRTDDLPKKYQKYAAEIDYVINNNVEHGHCGGCS